MRRIAFGLLVLAGCADPPTAPLDAAVDATPEAAVDAPADAAPDAGPPTLAPDTAPEPLSLPRWLVASVRDGTPDPVRVPVERGTFTLPAEGIQDGVDWLAEAPSEEGDLPPAPVRSTGYAATTFEAPAGRHCFAQADRVLSLSVNGAMQPGDVYGSGRIRVPLVTRAGENLLLVRSIGGRGAPRIRVWCTPHEVYLNTDDLTPPDFVVGQTGERWLGAAVLALTDAPAFDLVARVEANEHFEATEVRYPALAGGAVTQLGWRLSPRRAFTQPAESLRVALRVESPSLRHLYRREVEVAVVAAGAAYRHTRRSRVDGSVQYHAVLPPAGFDPARRYAMVLSLHGAGVEAIDQARAYAPKDWAYIVAPTNRRPFGFDWEVWGRLDGLEALDDASVAFNTDPERVYVTGHSMGGHGTWQFGALFPGRFATLGPSAGWGSFYSYTGRARPRGAFARSQASSDAVAVTTTNARSLSLDAAALRQRGVRSLTVDGRAVALTEDRVVVGPQDGKRPGQHGPFDEALRRPWCLVYPDDAPAALRQFAAYYISTWSVIGNGHGCALPRTRLTPALRAERSLVYLGFSRADVPAPEALRLDWDARGIAFGGGAHVPGAMAFVFPEGDGVSAVLVATPGSEWLLGRVHPFTSGIVLPDWMVWTAEGLRGAGFFSPTWTYASPTP